MARNVGHQRHRRDNSGLDFGPRNRPASTDIGPESTRPDLGQMLANRTDRRSATYVSLGLFRGLLGKRYSMHWPPPSVEHIAPRFVSPHQLPGPKMIGAMEHPTRRSDAARRWRGQALPTAAHMFTPCTDRAPRVARATFKRCATYAGVAIGERPAEARDGQKEERIALPLLGGDRRRATGPLATPMIGARRRNSGGSDRYRDRRVLSMVLWRVQELSTRSSGSRDSAQIAPKLADSGQFGRCFPI